MRGSTVMPMPDATIWRIVSSDEPSKVRAMPSPLLRKARHLGTHFQHLIAEAMAAAEQQHGFRFSSSAIDLAAVRPRVALRQRDDERLVVQRLHHQALIGKRQRHDRDVDFALAQQFDQLARVKFSCSISGICGTCSIICLTSGGSR